MNLARFALAVGLAAAVGACAQADKPRLGQLWFRAGCEDVEFPVYFQSGSDSLTAAAAQAIRTTAQRTRGCQVARISVTGLADADGGAERNLELSRQRAGAVARALADNGFPAPAFDLDAAGAAGARTADGKRQPSRRRTEVAIQFRK